MKRTVFITGASSGMGKAAAEKFANEGFTVYAAARRVEKMRDLQNLGINVLTMDVTDEQSMVDGITQILEKEGKIDILVNNAGYGEYGAIEDVPLEKARYQMEVNVFGAARLIQLVLPAMIENGYGKIVNITSIGGKIASAFGGWYHASKFALEALSDSLRNEVRTFGVDVIVVEPGGIKTEWGDIAAGNLRKISGTGRYAKSANSFADMLTGVNNSIGETAGTEPKIITDLIYEAVTTEQPETRYSAGFMAKEMLEMRKNLSDREFDRLAHQQLGM
ncbi:MAG: SDR family NAD(P)-dependent oxidoreductase [Prevotellaceae bacterium]|jgi:short-subunit dehydrogenase|nr:SDR family NAD(P)-dependent oxidoreductase [Prevotellaceae bacterium]